MDSEPCVIDPCCIECKLLNINLFEGFSDHKLHSHTIQNSTKTKSRVTSVERFIQICLASSAGGLWLRQAFLPCEHTCGRLRNVGLSSVSVRNFCFSASYRQKSGIQPYNLQKIHVYAYLFRKFRQRGCVYIKWNGPHLPRAKSFLLPYYN